MSRILRHFTGLALVGTLAGALSGCSDPGEFVPYLEAMSQRTMTVGSKEITLEVAATEQTRKLGLMNRKYLPEDHGMIFVFAEPAIRRFWMRDTYFPLSIAFVKADGTIVNIEDMEPLEEAPGALSLDKVTYALEMRKGWFQEHGIKAGDTLALPEWLTEVSAES